MQNLREVPDWPYLDHIPNYWTNYWTCLHFGSSLVTLVQLRARGLNGVLILATPAELQGIVCVLGME